ncbi:hypothetical protein R80B4_01338 [Fibrobacteres bacterium R8-0-B4]
MSINELNKSTAGSWSQFVSLKEAANKRNFGGPNAKAPVSTADSGGMKFSEILSSKSGNNVYLNQTAAQAFRETVASVSAKDLPAKGKMFDSYA